MPVDRLVEKVAYVTETVEKIVQVPQVMEKIVDRKVETVKVEEVVKIEEKYI